MLSFSGSPSPSTCMLVTVLAVAAAGLACPGGGEGERLSGAHPPPGLWHQVSPGERPVDLARRYQVPLEDLLELNGLEVESRLGAGQVVFVPGGRSPEQPRPQPRSDGPDHHAAPPPSSRAARPQRRGALRWPVSGGQVTSGFGVRGRRPHEGIDIAAPEGTAVMAAAEGTVIYAGSGVRGYGNLILLRHPSGLVTVYAHNRQNLVVEKEAVQAGQPIAEVGRTGNASASHLHFEVRRGEVPEDPLVHLGPSP